jgi:hypothetical protein
LSNFFGEPHLNAAFILGVDLTHIIEFAKSKVESDFSNLQNPSVSEWMILTDLLCLNCDVISIGYHRSFHLRHVWMHIKKGTFRLKLTPKLKVLLGAMKLDEELSLKRSLEFYGGPLLEKKRKELLREKHDGFIHKKQLEYWNEV